MIRELRFFVSFDEKTLNGKVVMARMCRNYNRFDYHLLWNYRIG